MQFYLRPFLGTHLCSCELVYTMIPIEIETNHIPHPRSLVENVTQMADSLETLRQKFEETIADHDQVHDK